MRLPLTLLACLAALPAFAESAVTRAQFAFTNPESAADCYRISARAGWQRVPLGDGGHGEIRVMAGAGWTVDAKAYDRVGPEGHTGAAARGLAPYAAYKYVRKSPFGALLARSPGGEIVVMNPDPEARFRSRADHVDFRINDRDEGLGDNAGALIVCAGP